MWRRSSGVWWQGERYRREWYQWERVSEGFHILATDAVHTRPVTPHHFLAVSVDRDPGKYRRVSRVPCIMGRTPESHRHPLPCFVTTYQKLTKVGLIQIRPIRPSIRSPILSNLIALLCYTLKNRRTRNGLDLESIP